MGKASEHASSEDIIVYFVEVNKIDKIQISEQRSVITSWGTTGRRTWEAALVLAEYLLSTPCEVRGRKVLELGAGTGFLSIILAKLDVCERLCSTDADESVLQLVKRNAALNGCSDALDIEKLNWEDSNISLDSWDVILGADITYDDSVADLANLLSKLPFRSYALIVATVRRQSTIDTFIKACKRRKLSVQYMNTDSVPRIFYFDRSQSIYCLRITSLAADA